MVSANKDAKQKGLRNENIPAELLKELGDNALKRMIVLVTIFVSRDYLTLGVIIIISLPKRNQAMKCSDHRYINFISRFGKIVACLLTMRWESKMFVEEGQML